MESRQTGHWRKWDERELIASRDSIGERGGLVPLGSGGTFGEMNREGKPSGFVRVLELKSGSAFYAQLRLPNGQRIQRKLGWFWSKRSRPPAGYLTRTQAEG